MEGGQEVSEGLRACLIWERFRDWLRCLGDRSCGNYLSPVDNVICRYLREATNLLGATIYPSDSLDSYVLACFVPWDGGWVELARVGDLPDWVQRALSLEEELYDETGEEELKASVFLSRMEELLEWPIE